MGIKETLGAGNFYENAPFPYRYGTNWQYSIQKRFTRNLALTMREQNTIQLPQGAPEPGTQGIHNTIIQISADYRVDLLDVFRR